MSKSKIQTQIKQITYFTCEHAGHQTEPLSRICIDKQCLHKTLICSICQEQKHKGHESIPLKKFLLRFYVPEKQNKQSQNEQFNPLYYACKIEEIRNSFFGVIDNFRTEINQILSNLETKAKIYFNNMSQKMLLLTQFQNPIQVMRREGLSQTKIKKYFQQILDHIKIKQKFCLSQKLSVLLQQGQQKQKQLSSNLIKIKSQISGFAQKIQKTLDPTSLSHLERANLKWSEQLKGAKIKINGTIAQQTGMESSGQRFILLEPSLTQEYSNGKVTWGIKVIKFVGWVGVGICLKNIITKANYFFNYSTIGHGSYMISNNGYSWSHSATQFNSAHKTFHYAQNDIVYVEYDRIAKKLRFRKNQSAQKFELDIVDPPVGDSYYPCVNICSTGDSVQIINPGIALS